MLLAVFCKNAELPIEEIAVPLFFRKVMRLSGLCSIFVSPDTVFVACTLSIDTFAENVHV
jgi:hypothetical protein